MVTELRDADFIKIRRFVYDNYGINLHDGKRELVKARLTKRLREKAFTSFADYFNFVGTKAGADELICMIDSLSTNLTSFFREESHFRTLRKIIPEIISQASKSGRAYKPRLTLWCAASSTGEEPYSLAMTLKEVINSRDVDLSILATDISTRVLKTAVTGIYSHERVKTIDPALLRKYFQIGQGKWQNHYRVKPELSKCVKFMRFNLMSEIPFSDPFDIIFCRNVMIYFDKKTQQGLVNRFYDCLKTGGWLFVSHSESLTGLQHGFKYIEPSIYLKCSR